MGLGQRYKLILRTIELKGFIGVFVRMPRMHQPSIVVKRCRPVSTLFEFESAIVRFEIGWAVFLLVHIRKLTVQ
ncbi:MAG: hypothetical protein ACI8UP_004706 [Porticoccaceae bacterium]